MEKATIRKDMIAMLAIVIICMYIFIFAIPAQIPEMMAFSDAGGVGSRTIPYLVVFLTGFFGVVQIIKDMLKLHKINELEDSQDDGEKSEIGQKEVLAKYVKTLLLFLLFILCYVLFVYVGYAAATIVALPTILFLLGIRNWKEYVGILFFSGVFYALFKFVLGINIKL